MRRKFLSVFLACMLLSGCNAEKTSTAEETIDISEQDSGMELIVEDVSGPYDKTIAIYRNVYTDVLYLWMDEHESGGLVEMHEPQTGFPLTYEKYKDYMENQ